MTNFADKFKKRFDTVKKFTEETFADFVAENEIQKVRIEICKTCDNFFAPTKQCLKCGCFLLPKTALKKSKCPIDKW